MFLSGFRLGSVLMLAVFMGLLVASPTSALTFDPTSIRGWFDVNFILIALVYGIAQKYWPPLASWNNQLINWVQLVGYMLTQIAGAGVAHAGLGDALGNAARAGGFTLVDQLFLGVLNVRVAREVYEFLGRPLLEGVFKWKKAVPKPA
jgi:hypothetical protein